MDVPYIKCTLHTNDTIYIWYEITKEKWNKVLKTRELYFIIEIQFQMHLFKMTEKRRQAIRSYEYYIFNINWNDIFEPEKKLKMHNKI